MSMTAIFFWFAKDCMVFKSIPKHYSDFSSLQNDFKMLIQISVDKCQVWMVDEDCQLYLLGYTISSVEFVRYLGPAVDSKISFSPHCLGTATLLECYVLALLHCCCQLHFSCTSKNLRFLESIQKMFSERLCGYIHFIWPIL